MDEFHHFRSRVSTSHGVFTITIPKEIALEVGLEMGKNPPDIAEAFFRRIDKNDLKK